MGADPQEEFAALSARVFASLPRSARSTDGAWDAQQVSASLRDLHASLRLQLAAQEADAARVDADIETLRAAAPREVHDSLAKIDDARREIDAIEPLVENAASHFATLVELLEPATHRLQTLDARASYLATALEIERRSHEVKHSAVEATASSLGAFRSYAAFVQTIPSEYRVLRKEAMRRVDELSLGIKTYAVEKLQTALDAIEWPRVIPADELETEKPKLTEIARAFSYLVTLHVSQLQAENPQKDTNKSAELESESTSAGVDLWAIECVLEPIRMRFKYHFERSESKTNRVTKPEWWLSHIRDQTRAHNAFLSSILTPELKKHRTALDCVDAQVLFLRGLMRTAMHKMRNDLPVILSERVVFCHTIDEVLLFEQAIDDEFGYDSYASSSPPRFPRVVDVLTQDAKTLFAWTKFDADYAKETLATTIFTANDAWSVATAIPPVASQFVALLDFMCRRFAHFSSESHRYVYISQVLFGLLHDFQQHCAAHARQLHVKELIDARQSLALFVAVVNAVHHVVTVLEAWDENPFFIELMRKVADSDQSRTQILKMHLQYSKTMLQNAAKAATKTILAREEAVAVRQAIAGPGAMIGPTAAFSAAYSVGSQTVKSLFGHHTSADQHPVPALPEAAETEGTESQEPEMDALLFSQTIFERHVREYKTLNATLIGDLEGAVVGAWRRALHQYRKSPLWSQPSAPECIEHDVSSELGPAVDMLQRVLIEAHDRLRSDESFSQLWKPLLATLDDALFSTASAVFIPIGTSALSGAGFSLSNAATAIGAVQPISPRSGVKGKKAAWSGPAQTQFVVDMNAIAAVVQSVCLKNPRAYLRKTLDLCRLVEMPPTKRREIHDALRGVDETQDSMEQITTILEACTILTLTPQQVLAFCEEQLGLE